MSDPQSGNRVPRETRIVIDFGTPDERRTTWGAFVADNSAPDVDLDAEELLDIEHTLFHGLVYRGGGGAAAAFTIERA
jgi:hypothetical protein